MLRAPLLLSAALPLALCLAACSAHGKPSSIETKIANAAKDVVIPMEAQRAANPTPDTPLSIAQGRASFQSHCALCHSSDGHSQNALGLAMYPPAMDLTSPHVQSWTDPELYWIIENGIRLTGMPAWQDMMTPEEAWKVSRYIHALPTLTPARAAQLDALVAPAPPPAPKPSAAATLASQIAYGRRLVHQEGCLMCHRLGSAGNDIGPNLTTEAKRHRSAQWLVGHFKDPAGYVPGSEMPAFDHLTPAQMAALVELLEHASR